MVVDNIKIWFAIGEQNLWVSANLGTGHQHPDGLIYIDTVIMSSGLVWHLFEDVNK